VGPVVDAIALVGERLARLGGERPPSAFLALLRNVVALLSPLAAAAGPAATALTATVSVPMTIKHLDDASDTLFGAISRHGPGTG
jgi:hypothetical protein